MITINTSLRCIASAFDGNLHIYPDSAFSGLTTLALLVRMTDPETRQLPTDLDGLRMVKNRLECLLHNCLSGIGGIGAVLSTARTEVLSEDSLNGLGSLLSNLAELTRETGEFLDRLAQDPRFPELKQ